MDQGVAKVIVNAKHDWLRTIGLIVIGLLLLSVPLVDALGWAVFAVLACFFVFAAIRSRLLEWLVWDTAEAHLHVWPLTLGSQTRVDYVRMRRRGTGKDKPIDGSVSVTCTEIVTYTIGTTTHVEKATPFTNQIDVVGQMTNNEIRIPFTVAIPIHAGAPSMDERNNEIRWDLTTQMKGMTTRNTTSSFQLSVAPVLSSP